MSKQFLNTSLAAIAASIGLQFTNPAQAIDITGGPVPISPATLRSGLNGTYWKANPTVLNIRNITEATAVINSQTPTATFTSTRVDYPNGNTGTVFGPDRIPDQAPNTIGLTNYLGVDAQSLRGTAPNDLTRSVFKFSGFINILESFDANPSTAKIDIDFSVSSDDGFQLTIGDTLLSTAGPRFGGTTTETASFIQSGLYTLDLIHFEDRNNTGIEFASSFSTLPRDIVPTEVLYTSVPTPAPLLGLLSLGAAVIRKRKQDSRPQA